MGLRRWLRVAAVSAVLGSAAVAAAQDIAAAEALFNRGLAQMKAGDFEKGCPALGESYRLDPRAGTLFTLAECEAKRGRIATAYVRYGDYLTLLETLPADKKARQVQSGREKAARAEYAALGPQVPHLTVALAPGTPRGAVVKRDDAVLAEPSLGVALPVDPGERVLTLEVAGKRSVERRVRVERGEKREVVLEAPADVGPAVLPEAMVAPAAPLPVAEARPARSGQREAGYAIGAVGIVGLGMGALFGGLAVAKQGSAPCGVGGVKDACTSAGYQSIQSARDFGNGSTAGLVAGGILAAAGVALVVTAGPRAAPAQSTGGRAWVGLVLAGEASGAVGGLRGRF